MNTEQTLHQMQSLKLTGMASAYQTLLSLPYDQHPPMVMVKATSLLLWGYKPVRWDLKWVIFP